MSAESMVQSTVLARAYGHRLGETLSENGEHENKWLRLTQGATEPETTSSRAVVQVVPISDVESRVDMYGSLYWHFATGAGDDGERIEIDLEPLFELVGLNAVRPVLIAAQTPGLVVGTATAVLGSGNETPVLFPRLRVVVAVDDGGPVNEYTDLVTVLTLIDEAGDEVTGQLTQSVFGDRIEFVASFVVTND